MELELKQAGHSVTICKRSTGEQEAFTCHELQKIRERAYGVYGIIEYSRIQFLVVVNRAHLAGHVGKHPVYEVKGVRVYTLGRERCPVVVKRLEDFFMLPGIFFSEYSLYERNPVCSLSPKRPLDNEFMFNQYPLGVYSRSHGRFGLRCIQGYFGSFGGVCLVSRRSCRRAGMRYFSRGCDAAGNCSNFVETEQFIDGISSYLQIRGSIPLFWSHLISWWYNPAIMWNADLVSGEKRATGFAKTDTKLRKMYKERLVYLNLIKEDGYEGVLWRLFKKELGRRESYHYNFHKDAGREPYPINFKDTGYTTSTAQQQVLVRTNCIDCLDRTNSMQYIIGLQILEEQLSEWGCSRDNLQLKREIKEAFRLLFYENGNYLSIQYSGTPALLAAHILGGKPHSKLRDGYLSVKRYLVNRLMHGRLQNSYDIVCGYRRDGPLYSVRRKCLASMWGFALCVIFSCLFTAETRYEFVLDLLASAALLCLFLASIIDQPL